jgi:hypothetical protein
MCTSAVITSIEPPGLPMTAIGVVDPAVIEVCVTIREADETRRTASVSLPSSASDGDIAVALVRCLNGCATMRGPELAKALQRFVSIR